MTNIFLFLNNYIHVSDIQICINFFENCIFFAVFSLDILLHINLFTNIFLTFTFRILIKINDNYVLFQVLINQDFNQKHNRVSMKPLHFNCLLRLSKSQLQENGFKDMVIEMIYGQLLEYLTTQSHKIGFPELSLICIVQVISNQI